MLLLPWPQVQGFNNIWIFRPLSMYRTECCGADSRWNPLRRNVSADRKPPPHLSAHEGQPLPQLGKFGSLALNLALPLPLQLAVLQARRGAVGKSLEWRSKIQTGGDGSEGKRSSGIKTSWLAADTHDWKMRYDLLLVKITLPPWDPYIYVSTDANTYTKNNWSRHA